MRVPCEPHNEAASFSKVRFSLIGSFSYIHMLSLNVMCTWGVDDHGSMHVCTIYLFFTKIIWLLRGEKSVWKLEITRAVLEDGRVGGESGSSSHCFIPDFCSYIQMACFTTRHAFISKSNQSLPKLLTVTLLPFESFVSTPLTRHDQVSTSFFIEYHRKGVIAHNPKNSKNFENFRCYYL